MWRWGVFARYSYYRQFRPWYGYPFRPNCCGIRRFGFSPFLWICCGFFIFLLLCLIF